MKKKEAKGDKETWVQRASFIQWFPKDGKCDDINPDIPWLYKAGHEILQEGAIHISKIFDLMRRATETRAEVSYNAALIVTEDIKFRDGAYKVLNEYATKYFNKRFPEPKKRKKK